VANEVRWTLVGPRSPGTVIVGLVHRWAVDLAEIAGLVCPIVATGKASVERDRFSAGR
jgi:hypothetical protein